jgi:hypothetical protein
MAKELAKVSDQAKIKIRQKHKDISNKKTPSAFIKTKPDGYEYVDEGYLRHRLNDEYPIWSWSPAGDKPVEFLGSEWVIVSGKLVIEDGGIAREFFSPGAARVQFKRGKGHTPENVVDIDKNVASANTNAFKRAINRLTNIADDIYRKQIEDPFLKNGEIEMIESMMEELDDEIKVKIRENIETGEIHTGNLQRTVTRIEQLITEKRENA